MVSTATPLGSTRPAMFAAPATRKDAPSTAAAKPLAPRVVALSWLVTAPTPANTAPTAPTAAPAVNAPTAGWPAAMRPSARVRTSATSASRVTSRAAASAAWRPTPAGAHQLGPAGLLTLSGVPHHGEDAHQRGQAREENEVAHGRVRADTRAGGQPQHPDSRTAGRQACLLDHVVRRAELRPPTGRWSGRRRQRARPPRLPAAAGRDARRAARGRRCRRKAVMVAPTS